MRLVCFYHLFDKDWLISCFVSFSLWYVLHDVASRSTSYQSARLHSNVRADPNVPNCAFLCAMFYRPSLSQLLIIPHSKRPAAEPSEFWENRPIFQKINICVWFFTSILFYFFIFSLIFGYPFPPPPEPDWSDLWSILVPCLSNFATNVTFLLGLKPRAF